MTENCAQNETETTYPELQTYFAQYRLWEDDLHKYDIVDKNSHE